MTRDGEERFEHPSYGMISFNRASNGRGVRLFGSSLREHYGTVRINIGPGTRIHELNHDRYHGSLRGELIEIEMSAAQFAEVITNMNQGSGIPCTIRYFNGKRIEDPPDFETEVEKIKNNFKKNVRSYAGTGQKYAEEIMTLCERLPKKARDQVRINLEVIQQQLTSNIPHVMEMFDEASTRVVTAAKHEIDAFAQNVLGPQAPRLDTGLPTQSQLPASTSNVVPAPPVEGAEVVATVLPTVADVKAKLERSSNKTQTFAAEQWAAAINARLEAFEAIEVQRETKVASEDAPRRDFFNAHAWATTHGRVVVCYISYQGRTAISLDEAERYLAKLEAGFVGRHFEALRQP